MANSDTAHLAWNNVWSSPTERAEWLEPAADVTALAETLRQDPGMHRALDLGCGVGRHALMLARQSFDVSAVDMAQAGIDELLRSAEAFGLSVDAQVSAMTELPFADNAFDYVLAFNVIYHGDGFIVRKTIDEIRRVLRPGGFYQGTMLSKRHAHFGKGTQVAPNTFVNDFGGDKAHPHFYCNAAELIGLFDGFELRSLDDQDHSGAGSWHWHLVAERLA